jgi:4-hydroxyacetophenone monooxygenase
VDNWYKSASGHVSQNWPLTTIEYWDLTRAPDSAHYDFSPVPHRSAAGS